MTEAELKKRLDDQDVQLAGIAHDIHRIKQFFLWTIIGSVVTFILPLIGAAILLPIFLGRYMEAFDGLL